MQQAHYKQKEIREQVEMITPKRIVITGITGFVGGYLAEQCQRRFPDASISGISLRKTSTKTSFLAQNIEILQADITNKDEMSRALAHLQPDIIFHLAAQSSVAASWTDPPHTFHINVQGTLTLLEVVRLEHPATRIILIGSGEQYGFVQPQQNPIHEDCPQKPANPYAASKAAQDLYGYHYFAAYGLPIVRVRAFNHFGPRQAKHYVIANLACQIALIEAGQAKPVLMVGNIQAKRDFLSVTDVVDAYLALAEHGYPGEVYNVGSGRAYAVSEILERLLEFTSLPIRILIDADRMRPVDIPLLEADISRLRDHTGWAPDTSLDTALKETLDYWRTQIALSTT